MYEHGELTYITLLHIDSLHQRAYSKQCEIDQVTHAEEKLAWFKERL